MSIARTALFGLVLWSLSATAGSGQGVAGGLVPGIAATVATLGQVFMGPLGGGVVAFTTVFVTNREPNQESCNMSIVFHQGSLLGGALPFINGQPELVALATVPRGGIRWFNFTADEDLIQGTATIFVESPCDEDSLSIQGTYHIGEGDQPLLTESFSVKPNTPNNWLRDDRCQAISTSEGTKRQRNRTDSQFSRSLELRHPASTRDSRHLRALFWRSWRSTRTAYSSTPRRAPLPGNMTPSFPAGPLKI